MKVRCINEYIFCYKIGYIYDACPYYDQVRINNMFIFSIIRDDKGPYLYDYFDYIAKNRNDKINKLLNE